MTTLREEANRYRDRTPPRLAPRREEMTLRAVRSPRHGYDDYDRADRSRENYREDGRYYVGGRYAPEECGSSDFYADDVL